MWWGRLTGRSIDALQARKRRISHNDNTPRIHPGPSSTAPRTPPPCSGPSRPHITSSTRTTPPSSPASSLRLAVVEEEEGQERWAGGSGRRWASCSVL